MYRNVVLVCSLLLLTLACFWPVGSLGFIGYDDYDYVYQNATVRSGLNSDSLTWAFGDAHAGNWHPVTWLSHMLDCQLFGLNPHEQHWVNLGFHAANVLFLFAWLHGLTGARWRSLLVAGLFALHPLHVQSVAWISERKDVLSGFFFLATLLAYTRYAHRQSPGRFMLVVVLFALGLMAKPMLVTVPLVLLLIDFWPLARAPWAGWSAGEWRQAVAAWRPLVVEKIPLFLMGFISCLVTVWAQGSAGAIAPSDSSSLAERCLHAVVAFSLYLGKLIWPVNLAIFYPLPPGGSSALVVLASLLLLGLLFAVTISRRRTEPYLLAGWIWFLVMLLPVIGLVQVGLQSIADRYVYLPSIGLFFALVWGVADLAQRSAVWRSAAAVLGGVSVLACGLDTRYQLGFWRDNVTLFQHVVNVSPRNDALGYFYLGISYGELGQLDPAARALANALQASPNFDLARSRLANVLLMQKKFAEAEPLLRTGVKLHPNDFPAHVTLGMALAGERKFVAAQTEYQTAGQLVPGNPALAQLESAIAPQVEAETTLDAVSDQLARAPTPELRARAAAAHAALGDYSEAVRLYRAALADAPDSAEYLNNLAWLLATCPENSIRNGAGAVLIAQRACELTHYQETVFLGTLAAACAEAGQFDAAVINATTACKNAAARGESGLLEVNRKLLARYQNHQPYHEGMDASAPDP